MFNVLRNSKETSVVGAKWTEREGREMSLGKDLGFYFKCAAIY